MKHGEQLLQKQKSEYTQAEKRNKHGSCTYCTTQFKAFSSNNSRPVKAITIVVINSWNVDH